MSKVNVAVVGATGVVGETFLEVLAERKFPIKKMYALASQKSKDDVVMFGKKPITVDDVADFDFSNVQLAFFSAGEKISALYAPKAADAGCVVIDNSSQFRYDLDIPLIVPEVNAAALMDYRTRNIIANPNCSAIPLVVALKPIYDAVGITRVNIATYQSVSGAGRNGLEELVQQTAQLLNGAAIDPKTFSHQIGFNLIPHIDAFLDNGYTREEMKLFWETQKILDDPNIFVNATAVRVPVFYGHSAAVHIETKQDIDLEGVLALLRDAPGVALLEGDKYPTPVTHAMNRDQVFVGRVRLDITHPRGINMWIVSDNVRKGAALNAVQIAELVLRSGI